jgi:hypothetical protein
VPNDQLHVIWDRDEGKQRHRAGPDDLVLQQRAQRRPQRFLVGEDQLGQTLRGGSARSTKISGEKLTQLAGFLRLRAMPRSAPGLPHQTRA